MEVWVKDHKQNTIKFEKKLVKLSRKKINSKPFFIEKYLKTKIKSIMVKPIQIFMVKKYPKRALIIFFYQ